MAVKKKPNYSSSDIRHLSSVEAIRLRPAVYLPDLGQKGIEHLFIEALDNSVDEASGGYAKKIDVIHHPDGSIEVTDNGRGIPCGKMADGRNALQTMLTETHAGGKFSQDEDSAYKASSGLNGVGVTILTSLSSRLLVVSKREGKTHTLGYEMKYTKAKGGRETAEPIAGQWDKSFTKFTPSKKELAVKASGRTKETGTTFRWLSDSSIFEDDAEVSDKFMMARLEKMSYLLPGVAFTFTNKEGKTTKFVSKRGLADEHPSFKSEGKDFWHTAGSFDYTIKTDKNNTRKCAVESVFGFKGEGEIHSYVNGIPTPEHGAHATGLERAFMNTVGDHIERSRTFTAAKKKGISIASEDIEASLTASIRVKMSEPVFQGQTKFALKSPEARKAVEVVMSNYLKTWLASSKNKTVVNNLIKEVIKAATLRNEYESKKTAQKQAKANARSNIMPPNLSDARYTGKDSEIFIVEGLSPSGQIKKVRTDHQALYPLKGRVINPRKTSMQKVRANREWADLARILGGVPGKDYDIDDFRYERVILTADEDAAGKTISATLALWFLDFYRPIIEAGNLFVAQTPLAVTEKGDPLFSAVEMEEYRQKNPGKKLDYKKGLGALSEEETRKYITGPEAYRTRITLEDAEGAVEMAGLWFDNDSNPRKERIVERSGLFIKEAE